MQMPRQAGRGGNDFSTRSEPVLPDTKRIVLDLTDLTHMGQHGSGGLIRRLCFRPFGGCSELQLVNLAANPTASWYDQSFVGIYGDWRE